MKKTINLQKKTLALLLALGMLVSAALTGMAETAVEGAPALESDILVLFTSDVHCGVDQNFGYAGLQDIRDAAVAAGDHVLLVDDGDSIQGESIGIITRGQADIELMNALKYDVAIPGNHEFDYGMERFMELAELAEFPYVSCNFRKDGTLVFAPYIIRQIDGVKLAFVGATTPETLISSTPRYFQDGDGNFIYDFTQGSDGSEFYAAVQQAVDGARNEGADYVFLVAHLGNEASCRPYTYADVIEHTTGLDAVLDGHSHDTDKVVMKDAAGEEVIRQACGTKLAAIGWLRISAADGSIDTGLYTWNNDVSAPVLLGIDNELGRLVKEKTAGIYESLSEVVGTANVELTINDPVAVDDSGTPVRIIRMAETNLGDFCADAFRDRMGSDVAVANGGSIRKSIPKGEMTVSTIMGVYPFGNRLCVVEATGQQLLDALEYGCSAVPGENGAFLHVSGLSYEIHTGVESSVTRDDNGMYTGVAGEYRVKNVLVNGEPLDMERTYTVAGQDYTLLDNGDGMTAFDGAELKGISEELDYQLVADYVRQTLGGVVGEGYENPYGQERIVAVEAPAEASGETTEEPVEEAAEEPALPELPEGVVPVTWEVSPEHLMIETDEARELYEQIVAGDYPTMEELRAHPVVRQLDALSAYYKALYGNTADIDTPEREALREEIKDWFLTLGSARTESVDENGKRHYAYDGPLNRDFQMELVLGLPASGKSTMIADPDSEAMGAFILDPDVIKAELPEYKQSHGAGADAVHFEGMSIYQQAIDAFLTGDMKGVNIVLPIVGGDLDEMLQEYVLPFEAAGYNVKVKCREAKENEAAARVVMRELAGGQLINSAVAFNFGDGPENVYNELKDMINANGEPYGFEEEEEARYQLDQVVILSRHNIRSPLSGSGSALGELTPHEWFDWTSSPSELSLRGAMLETTMGQYFRLWLEDEGLFPENYRPEDGEVRFYANAKQRTRATAHYFSAGLLPVVDVEVEQHAEYDTMDPVFTPKLTFVSDAYEADVRAQVAQLGGVAGMKGISAGLRDAMELLMDVADTADSEAYQSGKYGDLLEDENEVSLPLDDEPKLSGPIKTATSLADALTLQYYEEPDPVKAAFGHELTLEDWQLIHTIVDTYSDMLFTTPLVSVNVAHPLLGELRSELVADGRKFSFLCGHDSNVASVLAALGVEDYLLPEAIEQHTPIGVKLVFERWLDTEGAAWYNVSLVYQSVDQLRAIAPLDLENPPVKVRLSFKGVDTDADGMIAEADFLELLDGAIGAYDALVEKYGAKADEALVPAA